MLHLINIKISYNLEKTVEKFQLGHTSQLCNIGSWKNITHGDNRDDRYDKDKYLSLKCVCANA